MLTRKSSTKRARRCENYYEYKSRDYFNPGILPTKQDVLERLLFEDNWRQKEAATTVAEELYVIWVHCNVYCVSVNAITWRISKLVEEFCKVDAIPKKRRLGEAFEQKVKTFLEDSNKLFDIFCQDKTQRRKQEEKFKLRMNESDYSFYEDQNGPRNQKCANTVENLTPSDINFIQAVASKQRAQSDIPSTSSSNLASVSTTTMSGSESETSASETDASSSVLSILPTKLTTQNRSCLKEVAITCERFGISDRAGTAVATVTRKAFNIVTDTDKTQVIDRSKLRRERQKYREEIQTEEELQFDMVDGIYIDGRKDATITCIKQGSTYHRNAVIEEHDAIVGEPFEFYITHVTPENGTGKNIAQAIYEVIEDTSMENKLNIIGSDVTATMTGKNSGCISSLENVLGRPLQWIVCLLHLNVLPLRHIFQELDGKTKGPDSFSGTISRQLNGKVSA